MPELKQEWTDKIAAWQASGLSIAAWCRQHDDNYYRFLYWRRRLLPPPPKRTGGFVELTFRTSALLLSCNGMTLHLERGFDPELLQDVLTVLRRV